MTSEQLTYLIEISRNPSLNSASLKLHITPQALGASIKLLEEELHMKLLERTHRGSFLTPEGLKVMRSAQIFFDSLQEIGDEAQRQRGQSLTGNLTIVVNHSCLTGFLPHLICTLYKAAPEFRLKTVTCTQKVLYSKILADEHELGIVYQASVNGKPLAAPDSRLSFYPLFKCPLIAQMTHHFPIARQKSISMNTLLQIPLVLYNADEAGNASLAELIACFGDAAYLEQVANLPLFKEMVAEGLGATILLLHPSVHQSLVFFENLPVIPLNDDIQIYLGIITKKGRPLSHLAQNFLRYIAQWQRTSATF